MGSLVASSSQTTLALGSLANLQLMAGHQRSPCPSFLPPTKIRCSTRRARARFTVFTLQPSSSAARSAEAVLHPLSLLER
jgi:hypothetical protein